MGLAAPGLFVAADVAHREMTNTPQTKTIHEDASTPSAAPGTAMDATDTMKEASHNVDHNSDEASEEVTGEQAA